MADCCRPPGQRPTTQRQSLERPLDWPLFEQIVARHRVAGLVNRGLAIDGPTAPGDVLARIGAEARVIRTQNLVLTGAMIKLKSGFADAGVDHLFVKGLTLGQLAHSDPGIKMGWDIDVLVDAAGLADASAVLRALGYVPILPKDAGVEHLLRWHRRSKESVWADRRGVHVELHTRLADNAEMIPSVGMSSPRQRVRIAGHEFETLCQNELVAYLCVHGASSAWFRLKWIADLAALLSRLAPDELVGIVERATELGAGRSVAQAMLLATLLFDIPLSPELLHSFTEDRLALLLTRVAVESLAGSYVAQEPTQVRLGTLGIHLSQLLLLPGLKYKASEVVRQLSLTMSG